MYVYVPTFFNITLSIHDFLFFLFKFIQTTVYYLEKLLRFIHISALNIHLIDFYIVLYTYDQVCCDGGNGFTLS